MNEVYLDNSATTRVFPSVCDVMVKVMTEEYGNPSAMHLKGVKAEQLVKKSREKIAKSLKVSEKEIFFTSGGTESNNWAIYGVAQANKRKGNHIITTQIEHAAVRNPMKQLEEEGFKVTYLSVNHEGLISLEELESAITDETILVSIMYVNNEIGSVEPIEEIAKIIKRKNPECFFHVDAIQAYTKFLIRPKRQGIDLMSVSSHKFHGPKGVGFLYVSEGVKIKPLILGGGQQKGMRSGTDNVPGIVGMGVACEEVFKNFDKHIRYFYYLRELFIKEITKIEGCFVNGQPLPGGAPHIISVSFEGVRSEVLLHALEDRGVYASAGSACSSNHPAVSQTLKSIGVAKELLDSTMRFSFGCYTTEEDIYYAIDQIRELLPMLRRFYRH
ncbi:Cysteine desulfurase [Lachnospiraceae bacterium TWA4]|nr:Cysteine desulfurase [Lachnospiraceae bacterium TWA4]